MNGKSGELQPGLRGRCEMTVADADTAVSMGSGRMPVLATPAMVAWLEAAAQQAVDAALPPGHQTAGTRLDIQHHGATPVGMRVTAMAELVSVAGRNLRFRVTVHDEKELIGEGVHERVLFSVASFERLLRQKMRRE